MVKIPKKTPFLQICKKVPQRVKGILERFSLQDMASLTARLAFLSRKIKDSVFFQTKMFQDGPIRVRENCSQKAPAPNYIIWALLRAPNCLPRNKKRIRLLQKFSNNIVVVAFFWTKWPILWKQSKPQTFIVAKSSKYTGLLFTFRLKLFRFLVATNSRNETSSFGSGTLFPERSSVFFPWRKRLTKFKAKT